MCQETDESMIKTQDIDLPISDGTASFAIGQKVNDWKTCPETFATVADPKAISRISRRPCSLPLDASMVNV